MSRTCSALSHRKRWDTNEGSSKVLGRERKRTDPRWAKAVLGAAHKLRGISEWGGLADGVVPFFKSVSGLDLDAFHFAVADLEPALVVLFVEDGLNTQSGGGFG